MATITSADVRDLADHASQPVVSIYVTRHHGRDPQKSSLYFKNSINDARRRLDAWQDGGKEIEAGLERAAELIGDTAFWRRREDGVALFIGPGLYRMHETATGFQPGAYVGSAPHIVPLLNAIDEGSDYRVLAISRHGVRWFEGSRTSMVEAELPAAPQGVEPPVEGGEPPELQLRGIHRGNVTGKVAIFHGHGDTGNLTQEQLMKFLRGVNDCLVRVLGDREIPLVFFGDVSLFQRLRNAGPCPNLLDRHVDGNPETLTVDEIHSKTWPIIEERQQQQRQDILAELARNLEQGQGSKEIAAILHAARQGRVAHLVIASDKEIWGRYREQAENVQVLPNRENHSEDLQNMAAVYTLRAHGSVTAMPAETLPNGASAGAIYRF